MFRNLILCMVMLQMIQAYKITAPKRFSASNRIFMAEESKKNSFMDVLSGNAAVKAEKASNPAMFNSNNKKPTDRSKLSAKITKEGSEALLLFKVYFEAYTYTHLCISLYTYTYLEDATFRKVSL
jgi:hypothetical protein